MRQAFLAFLFILFFSCDTKTTTQKKDPLSYIPTSASVIVKLNDFQAFKSGLKNNSFLQQLAKTKSLKDFNEKLFPLNYFSADTKGDLCFVEEGNNNFELIFISSSLDDFITGETSSKAKKEILEYGGSEIKQYDIDGRLFYITQLNKVKALSTSKLQIENFIRIKGENQPSPLIQKLYNTASRNKAATVFINNKQCDVFFKTILQSTSLNLENFSNWLALDFNISQNELNINGIALADDSDSKFVNLFKNTHPVQNLTAELTPANALGFSSYSFSDIEALLENQKKYQEKNSEILANKTDSVFRDIDEIGFVNMSNSKAVVVHTPDPNLLNDFLNDLEINSEEYVQTTLHQIKDPDFLQTSFDPIVSDFKANYYCIIDNFFIFGSSQAPLRTIINNHGNQTVFSKLNNYESLLKNMADESTLLSVRTSKGIENLISEKGSKELSQDIKNSNLSKFTMAIQLVADTDFYHLNALVSKTSPSIEKEAVIQIFSTQLDAEIATNPQFVTNHRTHKKEVVVQDVQNNLYLIATDGKVLWKKQLDSKIQGKIAQVDLYKNGRLQLAFTTHNKFMVIDRNGEIVPPFNKKFESLLNPLAVFDYENKKDYRFIITTGNNIYMYDRNLDVVSGFNFTKASSSIAKTPSHFRIGSRDYLLFPESNGTLNILDRRGNKRIKLKNKITFSDNDIYLYKNKFTFTNNQGKLIQIDNKGRLNQRVLGLKPGHYIDATSKSLVSFTDNILTIKGKKVELEFGFYSAPKIFYLRDKIYVAITDIQNQKVYLFDSSATLIKNFPVYGTSAIDLADINNDRKPELTVKGPDDTLLVYTIN